MIGEIAQAALLDNPVPIRPGIKAPPRTARKNMAEQTDKHPAKAFRLSAYALGCAMLMAALLAFLAVGCSAASNGPSGAANNASDSSSASTSEQGSSSTSQQPVAVKEGATAPDFSFTTVDGTTARLSDYRGQVVVLNFWATWCGYCVEEMPDLQKISQDYPDVAVLAINRNDDSSQAIAFAQEKGYDFVWGLDRDGAIASLYPTNGIPYTLIIDKEGTIKTIYEGTAPNMYLYFQSAVLAAQS